MTSLVIPVQDKSEKGGGLSKGDQSRLKILAASLRVFAEHGYEGASTRMLADASASNLGAIQYHFGGKEGLYLATADYLSRIMAEASAEPLAKAQAACANPDADDKDLFEALMAMLDSFIDRILVHDEARLMARFIFREQMKATGAFDVLYEQVMKPLVDVMLRLVKRLRPDLATEAEVGVSAMALFGQIVVFGASSTLAMRTLGWTSYGPQEIETVRQTIRDQTRRAVGLA